MLTVNDTPAFARLPWGGALRHIPHRSQTCVREGWYGKAGTDARRTDYACASISGAPDSMVLNGASCLLGQQEASGGAGLVVGSEAEGLVDQGV